jgi:hypothetical protein
MLTCEYFKHEIDEILERDELDKTSLDVLTKLLVAKHFIGIEMSEFTEEMANMWVSHMENADGTMGAHWTLDATTAIRDKLGYQKICKYKFWAVMNSLYSDYGKSLSKTNITPEIYGELTRDWIEDADAVKDKAAAYYTYVVDHD